MCGKLRGYCKLLPGSLECRWSRVGISTRLGRARTDARDRGLQVDLSAVGVYTVQAPSVRPYVGAPGPRARASRVRARSPRCWRAAAWIFSSLYGESEDRESHVLEL